MNTYKKNRGGGGGFAIVPRKLRGFPAAHTQTPGKFCFLMCLQRILCIPGKWGAASRLVRRGLRSSGVHAEVPDVHVYPVFQNLRQRVLPGRKRLAQRK